MTADEKWWDPTDDFTPMEAHVLAEAIENQMTTPSEIDIVMRLNGPELRRGSAGA